MRGTGQMGGGLVTWWMDRPWWLRWIICLIPLVICGIDIAATGSFFMWLAAIGIALTVVNLFLSWSEILDVIMPRRDRDDG